MFLRYLWKVGGWVDGGWLGENLECLCGIPIVRIHRKSRLQFGLALIDLSIAAEDKTKITMQGG
jgi:hypothetical protein